MLVSTTYGPTMARGSNGRKTASPDATPSSADGLLSIGALSRACGVGVPTLRTWEQRYGYPVAHRKPSGHRVYPLASVERLRRISEALAQGHRAREVITASDMGLRALLGTGRAAPPPTASRTSATRADTASMLAHVRTLDALALTHALASEWGRLGPLAFLEERVAPLVSAVGEAWAARRIGIRHEHFFSERLGDLLRALRQPFEDRACGPLVVLGTMSGELHVLGLHMSALVLVVAGCRVCFLGADVPGGEMASLASDLSARAVGVSVSLAAARVTTRLQERSCGAHCPAG